MTGSWNSRYKWCREWELQTGILKSEVPKNRRFSRLIYKTMKPLPKWLIRFVMGALRGTTLATVGSKADCTHIALGASVLLAHQLSESPRPPARGGSGEW